MKVYILTLNYNPCWGLRTPDNREHHHETMVCYSKSLATKLGKEWENNRDSGYSHRGYNIKEADLLMGSITE